MKNECSITYPMTEDVKMAVRVAVELPAYLEDSYTQEGNLETRHFKVAQGHEFENNLAYESTIRLLSYKMREMDIPFSLVADNEDHLCKQEFRPDEFPREYVSIDNSASISAEELKQALQSKMSNQELRKKLAVYVDNLMPKTTIQQASEEYMAAPTNQYTPNQPFTFTLEEGPYYIPAKEHDIVYGTTPDRYMVLISFAGDDSKRYMDVYRSSDGNWYCWNDSWKHLIAGIKEPAIKW